VVWDCSSECVVCVLKYWMMVSLAPVFGILLVDGVRGLLGGVLC